MSTRRERAAHRRTTWTGQVVTAGAPKGRLYSEAAPQERLAALISLNERAWQAAGRAVPATEDRADWPGEVFELRCG